MAFRWLRRFRTDLVRSPILLRSMPMIAMAITASADRAEAGSRHYIGDARDRSRVPGIDRLVRGRVEVIRDLGDGDPWEAVAQHGAQVVRGDAEPGGEQADANVEL